MSNRFGISNLTNNLINYLQSTSGSSPTIAAGLPSSGASNNSVFLFLYTSKLNDHYRNHNETYRYSKPPVPLNLHYLLVFDFDRDQDAQDHFAALAQVIHSQPILPVEFAEQGQGKLTDQQEPIRLAIEELSLEDLSKMWTSFQSKFRLTLPFSASILMIDVEEKPADPVPILRRPIPGENIIVKPSMGARLLGAFGQYIAPPNRIEENTRLRNIPLNRFLVLETTGVTEPIHELEFVPTEKGFEERKIVVSGVQLEKIGDRYRVELKESLAGNQKWVNGEYQVRALFKDPFSDLRGSETYSATNRISLEIVPSLAIISENQKYSIVKNVNGIDYLFVILSTLPSVRIRNNKPGDFITDPPIRALLTQLEAEEASKSFHIPMHHLERTSKEKYRLEFKLEDRVPGSQNILDGEKYIVRIQIGDQTSHHFYPDVDDEEVDQPEEAKKKKVIKVDDRAVLEIGGTT